MNQKWLVIATEKKVCFLENLQRATCAIYFFQSDYLINRKNINSPQNNDKIKYLLVNLKN